MPKLKTKKGAAKRFKATATGKFKYPRANKQHILTKKSSKRNLIVLEHIAMQGVKS